MIIFVALWTIALTLVYKKIQASGQTAPKKGIFIAHIVLVSLYIMVYAITNLLLRFVTTENKYNIYSAYYILGGFDATFEVLIFFLVFYVLLKKGGRLKNSKDTLLINVTSAEELLKCVKDYESEETVGNLLACYDKTYFSKSLILNCID